MLAFKINKGSAILGDALRGVGVTVSSTADAFGLAQTGTKSVGQGFNNFGGYVESVGSSVAESVGEKQTGNDEKKTK